MDEPSDSSEDVVITPEETPRLTFDSALEATRDSAGTVQIGRAHV